MFSTNIISFYKNLLPPVKLPKGVELLYPQQDPDAMKIVSLFFKKYYCDKNKRTLAFGINPGRFGAGVTGINFTAPRQLKENCKINHPFKDQSELSAEFIYEMIESFGGPTLFFKQYFISAICPLGFIKDGKNLNYYDDPQLLKSITPFIVDCIVEQLSWNVNRKKCICIGGEKNFRFFQSLNDQHKWFEEIIPLPHPRFIMQYKRKGKKKYLTEYIQAFYKAEEYLIA